MTDHAGHDVTLIGADYSVYTRICRLALRLKDVPHQFETLDVFAEGGKVQAQGAGHAFGKIPILKHEDLTLFETLAITRYIDQQFDGPPLEPASPVDRARMNQIISIVDTQAYPVLVWGLHVPKSEGRDAEDRMLDAGRNVLDALESLVGEDWLCGPQPTLADIYLAPCFVYALDSAIGPAVQDHYPALSRWWKHAQHLAQTGATE